MYGDLAAKLIQDSRRTLSLDTLPLFQEDLVRAVTREIRDINRDAEGLMANYEGAFNPSQDRKTSCALFVQHLCMRRNKRCLLAYQKVRADRMVELIWNDIDLNDQTNTAMIYNNLSIHEQDYLHKYSDLLVDYKGEWTDIDLTGSIEPPKDLFIDVRVLKDAGEIQTEYG
jgi:GINS complex subunit 1